MCPAKKPLLRRPAAALPVADAVRADFAAALENESLALMRRQRGAQDEEAQRVEIRQGTFVIEADTLKRQAGYEAGLDRKTYKQLATGKLAPTAMLDLHGERADAFMGLLNWLSEAAKQGERVVLIITGKGFGHGEHGDMGVMKSQICDWLSRHPMVLAFATAQPQDGGAGAMYVLLRRWR